MGLWITLGLIVVARRGKFPDSAVVFADVWRTLKSISAKIWLKLTVAIQSDRPAPAPLGPAPPAQQETVIRYGDEVDRKCHEHKQRIRAYRDSWPPPDTRPVIWLPYPDPQTTVAKIPYFERIGGRIVEKHGMFRLLLEKEDGSLVDVVDRSGLGLFRALSEGDVVVFESVTVEIVGEHYRFCVEQCPVRIVRNHGLRTDLLWGRLRQKFEQYWNGDEKQDEAEEPLVQVIADVLTSGLYELNDQAYFTLNGCDVCSPRRGKIVYDCRGFRNFKDALSGDHRHCFKLCNDCLSALLQGED